MNFALLKPPNVVFILGDDLGYGDFSAFNAGVSKTPVLDELISIGVCLSQHYTASPVCNPSRAALLTGRYPHRTGSIDTLEWRGLETLDACGIRDNTLVVFSSDNGPQFGGEGDDCKDRFNCHFRGAKGGTYECGIRVPAILHWPVITSNAAIQAGEHPPHHEGLRRAVLRGFTTMSKS